MCLVPFLHGKGGAVCESQEVHLGTSLSWEEVNQRSHRHKRVWCWEMLPGELTESVYSDISEKGVAGNFLGKVGI